MTENGLITKAHANQIKSMQSINEMIAQFNSEPTISQDKTGKQYIHIRQVEANLDEDFGPDGWSWDQVQITPWGSVGNDKSGNPMIGICFQGVLTVCYPGGNCKKIAGVASDFVGRSTIKNAKGNKAAILSSTALKNAAAKLGLKYGRGYFDGYIAESITDAIGEVTAEQWEQDIMNAPNRDELMQLWGQIPKQFKAKGSKIHKKFSAKGKQLAAQSQAA